VVLHEIKPIRAIFLPLLARFNPGDITIKHHYTGDRVLLHSYRHKGYWFHGKKREWATMELFRRILKEGDIVIEVGAHIGYISLYFKKLVGDGQVIVFEPGINNLPYLRKNVEGKNIEVIAKAIGKEESKCSFFLDNLSGQNNSLVKDFYVRQENEQQAFVSESTGARETEVEMITLDGFVEERGIVPSFLKIDVEGFELQALEGMKRLLAKYPPIIMVEVQMQHETVVNLLERAGYGLFRPDGTANPVVRTGNVFCFHREKHKEFLREFAK
jgi:FkbM family methyltransferase